MKILHDFPAYRLIEPWRSYYADGDIIALPYHRDADRQRCDPIFRFFKFGSVAAYSAQCGHCPEARMAEARANGHELWWLGQQATIITSHKRPQTTHPLHAWGDTVRFHGRTFRIDPDNNGNAKLTEVEAA